MLDARMYYPGKYHNEYDVEKRSIVIKKRRRKNSSTGEIKNCIVHHIRLQATLEQSHYRIVRRVPNYNYFNGQTPIISPHNIQ